MKYSINLILQLSLTLLVMGCATTHPGAIGSSLKNNLNLPVKISAETIDGGINDAFQLISVTFENTSDRWVKISSARFALNGPTNISVVTGEDLQQWGQAMQFKLLKDQHNKEVAQTIILTGGTIAMSSNDKGTRLAGALATLGVLGWAVTDVVTTSYNKATQAEQFPENHLSHPFSVPGKLFVRRWILINKPSNTMVEKIVVDVETISGEKDSYEIAI